MHPIIIPFIWFIVAYSFILFIAWGKSNWIDFGIKIIHGLTCMFSLYLIFKVL